MPLEYRLGQSSGHFDPIEAHLQTFQKTAYDRHALNHLRSSEALYELRFSQDKPRAHVRHYYLSKDSRTHGEHNSPCIFARSYKNKTGFTLIQAMRLTADLFVDETWQCPVGVESTEGALGFTLDDVAHIAAIREQIDGFKCQGATLQIHTGCVNTPDIFSDPHETCSCCHGHDLTGSEGGYLEEEVELDAGGFVTDIHNNAVVARLLEEVSDTPIADITSATIRSLVAPLD
ncbi:uncharacterized protein L969DRAFT_15076 [Mixia osmundae IAM 14324]|uniref:uncharacterized protein n=1 Tax=Mixia osmundae (strain CBS 9802 / IAM 14324 / JCM 22182 / KY 12970) TaxID=764103 RepID=UPI0004A558A7|nr:uncharacterized protein L969DRAFT_15076 [Mixia osmundae IAM 14324]KEI42877.1 hypothetical protein L969DRAFT_15076 [Mixia osmundae IAM 14324]